MQNLSEANITKAVIQTLDGAENPRLRQVLTSLVTHLHAFIREVDLTEEEWLAGIQFLTATGQKSDARRQEFILLSDTLGASTLKDLINNRTRHGTTEGSLLGPFYRTGSAELPLGASIAGDARGEPMIVSGTVSGADGKRLAGSEVDVWQSDAEGFYDIQKMDMDQMNLRGRFFTDARGEFNFRTIKPSFYPIPDDGPVGNMLRALGRHPYRPAHIHFKVSADGYRPLTTELYVNGDPYLDSDVVFGVRSSLVVDFVKHDSQAEAARNHVTAPYYTLHYDFVLDLETRRV